MWSGRLFAIMELSEKHERTVFPLTFAKFLELFSQYGLGFVAVVCYCEYLNLPGFPAGIIMPALGVLAHQSAVNIGVALAMSILSGTLASLTMYAVSRYGGMPLIRRFFGKSERFQSIVDGARERLERGGGRALFVCRLIPVARTIVSIPAGLLAVPVGRYTLYSALGIACWNTAFILAGYFGSSVFLSYWG